MHIGVFTVAVFFFVFTAFAQPKPAKISPQKQVDSPAPIGHVNGTPASEDPNDFVFRPGEALFITTFPDTQTILRGMYRIDDDGFIDLPVVGRFSVTDKSAKKLADTLITRFVDYLRYPNLQVRPLIRVSLFGGFYKPGLYWMSPTSSLWDVVHTGGGTLREDGFKELKWERSHVLVKKDLVEEFQSGRSLQKMGFASGDQLWTTAKPKQHFWDTFRLDVLPIMSLTVTTVSTTILVYQIYRQWGQQR
jgi:protein involved in polysaccharide export with SLBB domain